MLCEAFPISDEISLGVYKDKGCTIISGDLYIHNLPITVTRSMLKSYLYGLRKITGTLHVSDNEYLTALTFLSELESAGDIVLMNNGHLVDARLPSLVELRSVDVVGCDRLCPARYPMANDGGERDDSHCTDATVSYPLHIVGSVRAEQVVHLGPVIARLIVNVTEGAVCEAWKCCMSYCAVEWTCEDTGD